MASGAEPLAILALAAWADSMACWYSGRTAGFFESGNVAGVRCVVAVECGESLLDLGDAAVAVHVAKSANVHEDVEAEGGAGVEDAESFVVLAAVAQADFDDFGDAGGWEAGRRCRGSDGRGDGCPSR